ncbi:ring finger domain protein [Diplodia corticola]|uniref:Ring finger domain protein n=1 Tax=Diplodia corticola TaxID=236234 RepID=A0A1J9S3E6_9PEZI|nr:ring finger domain protein [Diplodia corticola]OJD35079.1 ring finger domain protein [Diplodia corticola]
MGAPGSTNMSGVAAHQPPPQPRSSGRKRNPVSYAEDPPPEAADPPVKKRRGKAAAPQPPAAVDDAGPSVSTKQTKPKPPPASEKRLKRQDLNIPREGTSVVLFGERSSTDTTVSPTPSHSLTWICQSNNTDRHNSMFVIDRCRKGTDACPEEEISIAGTTGNIYVVNISLIPSCTCPHAEKGNQCKHIAYVLIRVLKAPPHLQYQLAFLASELGDIFSKAPPIPSGEPNDKDGRKPVEGVDCPICCEEFQPVGEEIVWCKAACGNNVHRACFEQWAATKGGHNVTCPYCRTPWAGDEDMLKKVLKTGEKNHEGYVNVASQLGLDGERDYSTYHPFWVRRQARNGNIDASWREFEFWDDY